MKERVFPLIFHKNSKNFFFDNCSFDVDKNSPSSHEVVRNNFDVIYSYTLFCSTSGPNRGNYRGYHFNIDIIKSMGDEFCDSLLEHAVDTKKYDETL
jgi:hypothetical protein